MRRAPIRKLAALLAALLVPVSAAETVRRIKPGFNLFTKAQDIQLGQEAAREIENEVQIVNDPLLSPYVSGLGRRLASVSAAPEYPYTFRVVADQNINAFALPGGPIYLHTGTMAAAENEAQLAGVLAHEIAHVALRHSTNQASRATLVKAPLVVAGGALGQGGSLVNQLARFGIGFGVGSMFLKYSRDAEHDADILGARNMAGAGYDPLDMARFFEKLQGQGRTGLEFLSDHPNPGNRTNYVQEEVRRMPQASYTKGSPDYQQIRRRSAQFASTRNGRRQRAAR